MLEEVILSLKSPDMTVVRPVQFTAILALKKRLKAWGRGVQPTRRDHPHTPFPLNLDFGDLNATNSKEKTPLNTILAIFRVFSIIWKVFGIFPKTLKNRENFGGVGVGGKGVWVVGDDR
jgi:hypothetical protein